MKHKAIRNLYPQVGTIDDTAGCFDDNGNKVEIDDALVQEEIVRLKQLQIANAYIRKRQIEYPPITELADALFWQSQGDNTKMTAYLAKVEAVKQKYPKE